MYNSMYECMSLLYRKIFLQEKYDFFLADCALPTQHDLYLGHSVANRDQEIPFLLGFCEVCEAAPGHAFTIIKNEEKLKARGHHCLQHQQERTV